MKTWRKLALHLSCFALCAAVLAAFVVRAKYSDPLGWIGAAFCLYGAFVSLRWAVLEFRDHRK